jgi:DNA-binding transcriptional ArsR family regulator
MDLDLIHKTLACPFRREVLAWLKTPDEGFARERMGFSKGVSSGAIHARSGLSQSTVSAHLALMVEAGLVTSERVGQWMFVSRNEGTIRAFAEEIVARL